MKKLDGKWREHSGPVTIWSKGSAELIPDRLRRVITIVMPIIYLLFFLFGFTATLSPVPIFEALVGNLYGSIWAMLIAISSGISLVGLIYRLPLEIYSGIVLTALLTIYPIYIVLLVIHDISHNNFSHVGTIYAAALFPIMPGWRVVDIVLELRKARQRQLYAKFALGEGATNDRTTSHDERAE
jgi:hypothetical protein